jgi:hypothetical protein
MRRPKARARARVSERMRPLLSVCLAIAWIGGASARAQPTARPRACDAAEIRELEVPRFVLSETPLISAWLEDDIVLVLVGPPGRGGHTQIHERPAFQGAIYETGSERWSDIPPPPSLPPGPSVTYRGRAVGERFVLTYYGQSIRSREEHGALVYDRRTRAWTDAASGAPEHAAFLTHPYREVVVGDLWFWFPHGSPRGYVLDARNGRWRAASTDGMPAAPNTYFMRALPSGRVLVPDASEPVAGLYDPSADRWETIPFARLGGADFASVEVAPDGTIAVLVWEPPSRDGRTARAAIVSPSARTVTALPALRTAATPNARLVVYDGARLAYLDPERWHRFENGRWTHGRIPVPMPLHDGGAFRPVCGGRAHLIADHHWLVDLRAMSFQRIGWRDDIQPIGRVTMYDDRWIAILGESREELEPHPCPPGAPCLPPARHRVESVRGFLVPFGPR